MKMTWSSLIMFNFGLKIALGMLHQHLLPRPSTRPSFDKGFICVERIDFCLLSSAGGENCSNFHSAIERTGSPRHSFSPPDKRERWCMHTPSVSDVELWTSVEREEWKKSDDIKAERNWVPTLVLVDPHNLWRHRFHHLGLKCVFHLCLFGLIYDICDQHLQ